MLTVATLNVLDDLRHWEQRAPLIVEQFRARRPDVISLQEVSLATPEAPLGGARSTADWLAEELDGYTVLFSPSTDEPQSDTLAMLVAVEVETHDVLTFAEQGRRAQRARLRLGTERWTVVNTHLYWHPFNEEPRVRQASELLAWIADDTPAVVCGDFNAMPDSRTLRMLGERLTSAHAALHGSEPLLTYPTNLRRGPGLRHWSRHAVLRTNGLVRLRRNVRYGGVVDYVMVDGGVEVVSCEVLFERPSAADARIFASDHLGLLAVLTRPGA